MHYNIYVAPSCLTLMLFMNQTFISLKKSFIELIFSWNRIYKQQYLKVTVGDLFVMWMKTINIIVNKQGTINN